MYGSHRPAPYVPAQQPGNTQPEWQQPVLPPHPSQNQQSQPEWHLQGNQNSQSFSSITQTQLPPPPPPPPPPMSAQSGYNPHVYGPISGQQGPTASTSPLTHQNNDATTWGIRYNYNQGPIGPSGPPLPPRSTSAAPTFPSHTPPLNANPPQGGMGIPYSPAAAQPSWAVAPPPPPPVPHEYRVEMQQNSIPRPQSASPYQGQPGTHHYDPPQIYSSPPPLPSQPPSVQSYHSPRPAPNGPAQNNQQTAQGQWPKPSQNQSNAPPTSTRMHTSSTVITGASALGSGGPSDWEHYSSTPGYIDSSPASPRLAETPAPQNTAKLPTPQSAVTPTPATHDLRQTDYGQQQTPRPSQQEQWTAPPVGAANSKPRRPASPPKPSRFDSVSSRKSDVSAMDGTDTIDGVIQVWNHPISPMMKPQNDNVQGSPIDLSDDQQVSHQRTPTESSLPTAKVPRLEIATKNANPDPSAQKTSASSPPKTVAATSTAPQDELPVRKEIVNPYEDLDPWSKSSLARFVAMLRKEAVAESDEDRFKIFTSFVAKETKLREILYNIEPTPVDTKPSATPTALAESPVRSKSLGAVLEIDSGLIPVEIDQAVAPVATSLPERSQTSSSLSSSGDVVYSPGGRPILNVRPPPATSAPLSSKGNGLHRSVSNPSAASRTETAPTSFNPPIGCGDGPSFREQNVYSRSASVPPSSMAQNLQLQPFSPLQSNPPQPAYVPFRYSEGPPRGSEVLVLDKPAYQAYSALRQASAESGRVMTAAVSTSPPTPQPGSLHPLPPKTASDETFLGLIREKSVSYRGKRLKSVSGGLLEEVCALIPTPFPTTSPGHDYAAIRDAMEKFPDDFSFIEMGMQKWDENAAQRLRARDQDRMSRQEESEQHIDDLFNDKVIGYADINQLEEEFRQKEARMQLQEERKELEDFIREVFAQLDTRLKEEIVELKALVERATEALRQECRQTNQNSTGKFRLSYLMDVLNDLSAKLELRYQKRLEIALDRERRRKKAERRPLIFLGESKALKKLDGDFDRMEKQNKVEAAKDRDERANKLMDAFDDAIMSGLGDHQKLIDGIAAKVKKLDIEAIRSSPYPDLTQELVLRSIIALVNLVLEDTESILQSFGTADTTLNDADYNVSVAEARYSSASADIFHRLDEEKQKEDAKIQADLTKKLTSVRKGPTEIISNINSLLVSISKEPGPGSGPWGRPHGIVFNDDNISPTLKSRTERSSSLSIGPVQATERLASDARPPTVKPMTPAPLAVSDFGPGPVGSTLTLGRGSSPPPPGGLRPATEDKNPTQQERLRKALEDAKKRNAVKQFST